MARIPIGDLGSKTTGALRASLLRYFIVGATLIVAVKLVIPGLLGAIVAAIVALFAVGLKCRGHWEDRGRSASWASDEVYYLGLLYTLISLILAIIQLFIIDASDAGAENLRKRTNDLIGNFGIALSSTVAGILGRILLQTRTTTEPPIPPGPATPPGEPQTDGPPATVASPQSPGPYVKIADEEFPLSWDLRELLLALRRNLSEAADAFAHFTRITLEQADGTRASVERVIAGFNERLVEIAQSEIQSTAANWSDAIAAMRTDHEAAVSQTRREIRGLHQRWTGLSHQAQTEIERLTEHFGTAATQALQQTEAGWSQLAASLTQSAESMRTSSETHNAELKALLSDLIGIRQRLQPFGIALADTCESIETFKKTTQELEFDRDSLGQALQLAQQSFHDLNEATKRVDANLIAQAAEMGKAHQALADGYRNLIEDVDALCRIALDSIADRTQNAKTTLELAVGQASSLEAKIEGIARTLDTQNDRAERNAATLESLLKDLKKRTDDNAERHVPSVQDAEPESDESPNQSPLPQQNANPTVNLKSKPWWKRN